MKHIGLFVGLAVAAFGLWWFVFRAKSAVAAEMPLPAQPASSAQSAISAARSMIFKPATSPPAVPPMRSTSGASTSGAATMNQRLGTAATVGCVGASIYFSASSATPLCAFAAPVATMAIDGARTGVKTIAKGASSLVSGIKSFF